MRAKKTDLLVRRQELRPTEAVMTALDGRLGALLDDRKGKGRFRSLKEYDTSQATNLIDFSSNDYLSLTDSPALRDRYLSLLSSSPHILGSTGSRLLSGSTPEHSALEKRFSEFFDAPDALLFNSGWDANVSFFSTVPQSSDIVIYDDLVHASVHSGLRASRVPPKQRLSFRHNDAADLRTVLKSLASSSESGASSSSQPIVFLALESLYSMDGDMAPLKRFLDILDEVFPRERQCVVLDEAHTTGVYGRQGRGLTHALGEHLSSPQGRLLKGKDKEGSGRVGVRLMTFGKAVGCSGAVLLCSPTIRSFLINFARPLIFSTALPHSTLLALYASFDIIQSDEGERRRQSLYKLSRSLDMALDRLLTSCPPNVLRLPPDLNTRIDMTDDPKRPRRVGRTPTPIFGIITPKPHALSAYLLEKGFIVRPVVPPTVPVGSERVRICLRADISLAVVDRLVQALHQWVVLQTSREGVVDISAGPQLRARL